MSGIIQQLLERLEYLFPDQMKAWRKEQNIGARKIALSREKAANLES